MKTFETEKRELVDWLLSERDKYHAEVDKMIAEHKLSRDSEAGLRYQEAKCEYNRRLVALKVKYNIPTTEHELLHWGDYVE